MYSLQFEVNAISDLRGLPKNARNLLKREIPKRLVADPAGSSRALTGPLEGFYSCQIRQYRVVFLIVAIEVWIVGVGAHSQSAESDVYRRLEDLRKRGQIAGRLLDTLTQLKDLLRGKE